MEWKNIVCHIFVYIVVVSPIFYKLCEGHGVSTLGKRNADIGLYYSII